MFAANNICPTVCSSPASLVGVTDVARWNCLLSDPLAQASLNCVVRTELFLRTSSAKLEKIMPNNASKIGATLKSKNLLPQGANSYF